jgi:hypothetical protein
MPPFAIKGFKCINNSVGTITYPQLLDERDPSAGVVWNGRSAKDFKYMFATGMF